MGQYTAKVDHNIDHELPIHDSKYDDIAVEDPGVHSEPRGRAPDL